MTPRIIAYVVGAALLVALIAFGPAACNRYLTEKKARQVEQGQAGAVLDTVEQAGKVEAERQAEADAIRQEAKELADEVRNAPAGDSNAAADAAVCRLRQYRDHQRCAAMRSADPAVDAGGNTAR